MAASPRAKYVHSGSSTSHGFNPNGPYYRTCCCHVRKLTLGVAIIEIFIICFLLVAVIPDLNVKICGSDSNFKSNTTDPGFEPTKNPNESKNSTIMSSTIPTTISIMNLFANSSSIPKIKRQIISTIVPTTLPPTTMNPLLNWSSTTMSTNDSSKNYTDWTVQNGQKNAPLKFLHFITCQCNVIWLTLAVIHIISANIMFYGLKTIQWYFFIPHVIMRMLTMLVIITMITMLIIGLFGPTSTTLPKLTWILTSMSSIFCLIYGYFIWIEIKCIHFVKLSKETGFSYSNTRPVGPPTLSLDEQRPQNQQNQNITTTTSNLPMQQLNNRPATTDGTFPQSNITSTTLPPLRHTYGTGHIGQ